MEKTSSYPRFARPINGHPGRTCAGLVLFVLLLSTRWAVAQNIVFPPESGVVNLVTDPRYLLRPNDNSPAAADHNSAKIQQAIDDCSGDQPNVSQTLYFPNGTYYVNKKLTLGDIKGQATKSQNVWFQGQNRDETIIRLLDASPGFGEVGAAVGVPVLVFFEGNFNNTAAANYVRNLTIDIGANNPNAIGLDFHNNNQGGISDVTIKTRDSQRRGNTGLKMNIENTGIGYIQNVRVEGFDYGIKVGAYIIAYVYEDIELEGQRIAGLVNQDKPIQIRRLTSRNAVPAIINTPEPSPAGPGVGSIVIIDSKLLYTGDPNNPVPAINNREGSVFARNLTTNYPVRILDLGVDRSAELPDGGEFSSRGVYDINGLTTTGKSMNLPIKTSPVVSWDEDFNNWAIVDPNANGTGDDADAINAAIATGKSTVCVRYGTIFVNKTIKFPDGHNVKRFLVLGNMKPNSSTLTTVDGNFDPAVKKPVFEIGTGVNDALVIEGIRTINGKYFQYIQNNSKKPLILRHMQFKGSNRVYRNRYDADHTPGPLFIEDVASAAQTPYGVTQPGPGYLFDHQEVYARSINPENVNPFMVNQGGTFWVLGFKTEGLGVPFTTTQGGYTEVLGGEVNGVFADKHLEIINNVESSVSIIASEKARFDDRVRDTVVVDTQNGVTKYILKGVMPQTAKEGKYVLSTDIPLYISYANASVNTPPVATANASQTATVGVAFSYTVNAFTDEQTPNSLTYTATGLPPDLTFDATSRVISGTLSTTVGSPHSVTITATDPGTLSATTVFSLVVVSSPTAGTLTEGVRIFEIFGGGGTINSGYKNDYVMLANYGPTPVSLDGYSLQYASAGANGAWLKTDLSGTIQPGFFYLIQEYAGGVGTKDLPTPDATGTINIGPGNGKVALFSNQTVFTGADPQTVAGSGWADLVGYGSNGDVFRGTARGPAGNNSNAIGRSYTAQPVDDNSVDFSARPPAPRNSTNSFNEQNRVSSLSVAASASPTTILTTETVTLSATASGGTAPYIYSFTGPGTIISSGNTATVTGLPAGVQDFTILVRDASAPVSQAITATVSVTVSSPPPAATVRVLHQNADNDPASNAIRPTFQLLNRGSIPVSYSAVTLRYWLTVEEFSPMTNLSVYYAQVGTTKVKMKYVRLDQPRQGALGYVEYSFDASAGNLLAGATSGPIQSGVAKQNYTAFNETDDYSYSSSQSFVENPRITAYLDGQLVWGIEPEPVAPRQSVRAYSQSRSNGSNSLSTFLSINNDGNLPLVYKDLRVRYWFTAEGTQPLNYWVDYAELGNSKVKGQFVRLPLPLSGADTYFEVKIDSAVGNLLPLSSTGAIQYRLAKTDWSNFVESNDFSYKAATQYVENDHITIYYRGALLYGVEPVAISSARLMAELDGEPEIVAYPNPATSSITVRQGVSIVPVDVTIYGLNGQIMQQGKTRLNTPIRIEHLPSDLYLLEVRTDKNTYHLKVIKQ